MKNNSKWLRFPLATILTLFLSLILLTVACKKEPINTGGPAPVPSIPPPPPGKVNPNDPNAVTSALVVNDAVRVKGDIPAPQKPAGDTILISGYQTGVEVSAGGEIILPQHYDIYSTLNYSCTEYYVHVQGADSSIKIKKNQALPQKSGIQVQRIRVPSRISFGSFCLTVGAIYVRADGSIYIPPTYTVCVNVSASKSCGNTVSGSEGLTFTSLTLGSKAGMASVNYNTYSIPDRIDVYYNGNWVAGTGTDPGPVPPQMNCSNAGAGDGFVGQTGQLSFQYDPALSKDVTVVVSGCLGSSTAWDYTIECPQ